MVCVSVMVMVGDDEGLDKHRGAVDSIPPPSFTASERNDKNKTKQENMADGHPSYVGGKSVVDEMKVLVAQSCLTLCDPVDCSPPGSSVHGILQARILGWVAISFSRGSSQPRD